MQIIFCTEAHGSLQHHGSLLLDGQSEREWSAESGVESDCNAEDRVTALQKVQYRESAVQSLCAGLECALWCRVSGAESLRGSHSALQCAV